ncbi:MAG: ComEC/Rec2 family competence protein [Phycisphaerales bacterium]
MPGRQADDARSDRAVAAARVRALAAVACVALGFVGVLELRAVLNRPIASGVWFGASLLFGAATGLTRGRLCAALLALTATLLAAGWFTFRVVESPRDRLRLPPAPAEVLLRVEGVVIEPPQRQTPRGSLAEFAIVGPSTRLTLDLRRVQGADGAWRTASGRLIVFAARDVEAPIGRRVRVSGIAAAPPAPTNPGQGDSRLWSAQRAVVGTLSVPDEQLLEVAASTPALADLALTPLREARAWLHARARAGLEHIQNPRARAMAGSLLLGAEEEEGRAIATTFQRIGLAHVLAISGVHMAMLAWATLLALRLLGDFGAMEPLLAAGAVLLYMLVVPAEAPIIRSGVMVLAVLLADALGRRYDGVAILAWTAVIMLLFRPMDLFSLGFQLSFGVTGVLLGGGRAFHRRLWGAPSPLGDVGIRRSWWRRALDPAKHAASASLLAWAVASPWIAARVGLLAPLAPISSLIVGVPVSLLMLAGFLVLLLSTLVPGAEVLWRALEPLASATLWCVDTLDTLPGASLATGSIPLAWGGAASVGVLWLLTRGRWTLPLHGPRIGTLATWSLALALGAWLAISITVARPPGRHVALRLDTLDVGDATCHVIRSGSEAILWDCGASWAGAGEVRIPGAVRALGTPPIRTAIITHANFDHYNALPDAAWRLGVRRVLVSPLLTADAARRPTGASAAFLALLRRHNIEIVEVAAGDRLRLADADIEFLWPDPDAAASWPANDQSLVARIRVNTDAGPRHLLMTGDIQARAIASLLTPDARDRLAADVIEAPHHGSYTREAAALVETVAPAVIVQSTGRTRVGLRRRDDPRWPESIAAAAWIDTATHGAVWVEINRDGSITTGGLDHAGAARPVDVVPNSN